MIQVDHIGVTAKDTRSSAYHLAKILGTSAPVADGPDGDMYRIDFGYGTFVLFNPIDSEGQRIDLAHVAFRVTKEQFDTIVGRLKGMGVPFGNRHDDTNNGQTEDFELGGAGRVYFVDENGHLFEVTC